jgi:hypothetical protein
MNVTIFYASRSVFQPLLSKWPELKAAYPFADLVYNYGWSNRPFSIMASRIDKLTSLQELGERIGFDYGLSQAEVLKLQVAGEKNGQLTSFNSFKHFLNGYNADKCTSVIVQSPDGSAWYVLVYDKKLLADFL